MAVIKHIASKNADYGESERYLIFQHNEYTQKPILDDEGHMILRDEYYLDGLNCDPFTFASECQELNSYYHKNKNFNEIKSHHYIISFDPKDREECGYDSLEDFHIALDQASDQTSAARKSLKDTKQQLKDVNEQIHFTGQYLAYKNVYVNYRKSRNKDKFYEEHRAELSLYDTALRTLKEKSAGNKLPSMKALYAEKDRLIKLRDMQREDFSNRRNYEREFRTVSANIDMILGKSYEQEQQIEKNRIYKFPIFMLSKKRYYIKKRRRYIQMKAHKYWSLGALAAMIGTFYTGYKNMKSAHKYFACSSLLCMIMAIYSGHKMLSAKSRKKKDSVSQESAE